MASFLFRQIDNAPLLVFRVLYGLLVAAECFGAIATGWVRKTLVEPDFTFTFLGFEWLQPLPGDGMYLYFAVMGCLGIMIALGYRYRFAALGFALMWTAVYLMQKTSYNNHYYLLLLLAYLMAFLPAHRDVSLDARRRPEIRTHAMDNWVRWTIILQLFLVYTYAAVAKLYGDWLNLNFMELLMRPKADYWLIGGLLQKPWTLWSMVVFGFLFDLLIVPALLWRPSRKYALWAAVFFHLFNSAVFQIGIFPYLSLAFLVFFFEPALIRRLFLRPKAVEIDPAPVPSRHKNLILGVLGTYFLVQLLLPLRHFAIPGDVLWNEEGHRMSWRMMLRSRSGTIGYRVVDKSSGRVYRIDLKDHLTPKQAGRVAAYPDFAWQFAQYLKAHYTKKGADVQVFVNSRVRINQGEFHPFIDPKVDLAAETWKHFSHNEWILPAPWE